MNTNLKESFQKNIPEKIIENISKELLELLNLPKYNGFYIEKISASNKEASVFLQKKPLKS
jgi:hypothetical protein